jgi:hypothetical protein
MNAENENVLSMAQTVQAFYTDNQSEADAALPALATQMLELGSRVTNILLNAAEADQDITGYAADKQEMADNLIALTRQVGNACATYYTLTQPSRTMRERVDWTKSELTAMRDSQLYVSALKTWQIADPIKANLADYGVTAGNVDELQTALEAYLELIQNPQQSLADRSAYKKEEDKMIADLRKFFRDVLDQLFEPLAVSHTILYDKYKASRSIVDMPGGNGNDPYTTSGDLLPNTSLYIPLPATEVKIYPSTSFKLRNTSFQVGLVLKYYFYHNISGVPTDDPSHLGVMAGSVLVTSAAELGYSQAEGRVFLIVQNPAEHEQSYFVEI